nr:tail fiber protein [uncultured Dyadobacter sp.]
MEPFLGEIRAFAGIGLPANWAFCDGSLLSVDEYSSLFLLIGNKFGGDGITNFALPDLRSRIPMGQSANNPIGRQGGAEKVQLAVGNLPVHRHTPACSTATKSDSKSAVNAFWSAAANKGIRYAKPPGNVSMNMESLQLAGESHSHENRMPVLAVTYIISLSGTFPTHG